MKSLIKTRQKTLKYLSLVFIPTLLIIMTLSMSSKSSPNDDNSGIKIDAPQTYKGLFGIDRPIDTTLIKASGKFAYKNTTNRFKTYFKNSPTQQDSIVFRKGRSEISFFTPTSQTFGSLLPTKSQVENNSIIYQNIYPSVDLKYTVSPTRLLEEFIIQDEITATTLTTIDQQISTKNIDSHRLIKGGISFYRNNQLIYSAPKPVMYELNNKKDTSYGIKYEVTKNTDNQLAVSKKITQEGINWLSDPKRQYPIVIDLVIDNADTSASWVSSDTINLDVEQETTIKQEGTGSVKLDGLSYAGDGADGALSPAPTEVGDGADGALAPSGTFNLNSSTSGARSYADGIAYKVSTNPTGTTIVTTDTPNGLVSGDELLLINLQGTSADNADVGNYEIIGITSVDTGTKTITTSTSILNSYDGTTFSNQKVIIQRVPNYTSVTLDSTDSLTATAWDALITTPTGAIGYYSGTVVFKATGTVTVGASTSIDVDGLGYQGGTGYASAGGQNGESYDGFVGAGGNNASTGTYGGGTGNGSASLGSAGNRGGGAGGGGNTAGQTDDGGGGGGGGAYGSGGGGGGGATDCSTNGGDGGAGGTTQSTLAGGGGGGNNSCSGGAQGDGGAASSAGANGDGTGPGTGGSAGSVGDVNRAGTGQGGSSVSGAGVGSGGAGGGGAYGNTLLTSLYLGSGGGGAGGDSNDSGSAPSGGDGGGIIIVFAATLTNSGTISSDGVTGTAASTGGFGGSGGGAGGSIRIDASTSTLGSSTVTASGGSTSAKANVSGGGGAGSVGRIKVNASTISGATSPSAETTFFFNLNTNNSGGRTYADGIAYKVNADPTGTSIVTTDTPNGIAVGDELLLINLQGTSADNADVGNYEFLQVDAIDTGTKTITTTTTIQNSYDGTTYSNQKVIIQRVPNYSSVTINNYDELTSSSWDAFATTPTNTYGYYTGVVAFRSTGTVSIASGTSINVGELGYQGGSGGVGNQGGTNGESYDGTVGSGGASSSTGTSGGGSGDANTGNGTATARGGGGGGGGDGGGQADDGGGGAGGGAYAGGGGGGGAGSDSSGGGGTGGTGGTAGVNGGGGGGDGSVTTANGGNAGSAGSGPYGGAVGSGATTAKGGGGYGSTNGSAGGGGGGGTYGSTDLSTLYLGSGGGGGGGRSGSSLYRDGGNGGGIIYIGAATITVTSTGTISSNGADGTDVISQIGGSGGGAGGSILIQTSTSTMGTTLVTADGGAASAANLIAGGGGAGGDGRIRVESTTKTGTTSPTYSGTTTPSLSLDDTSTLTKAATDLSGNISLTYYVRSDRTGAFSRFEFGESASGEQTNTITILAADTWEQKTWDISGLSDASRNAVTKFAFKVTDQSQNVLLYFDDIQTLSNNTPPSTPSLDTPIDTATNQLLLPALLTTTTDPDSDYLRYKIDVCENVGMSTNCNTHDQTSSQTGWSGQNAETSTAYTSGTQATYTIQSGSPLVVGITYYWRSYAIDPAGENTWSSTQGTPYSFTVTDAPTAPTTPYAEGSINPSGILDLTPELSAIHNDPNADNANYYQIDVDTAVGFDGTQMWDSTKTSMTSTADTVRSPNIPYGGTALSLDGTTYYWRVKFWDVSGAEGVWSTTQNFGMNDGPATPSLDAPTDTATNQLFAPALKTTTTDPDSDYLRYKIDVCENMGMSTNCNTYDQTSSQTGWSGQDAETSTAYASGTQATHTLQSDLAVNTTYYWRSYAIDPGGTNTWTSTQGTPYSFTTQDIQYTSSCSIQETVDDSSLTLYWVDEDSTEDGFDVDRSANGAAYTDLVTKAANSTSHTDSTISQGNKYQYRIRSYIGTSYGEWCYTAGVDVSSGTFKLENINFF